MSYNLPVLTGFGKLILDPIGGSVAEATGVLTGLRGSDAWDKILDFWTSKVKGMVSMSSSRFPGFDNLYSFESKGSSREFVADIDLGHLDPLLATRGEQIVRGASARWAMGGTRPDQIVWTRLIGPILLASSVVEALQEAGASGWKTYPVALLGKNGEAMGTYFGLQVTGRCGQLDPTRCAHETQDYPAGSFPVLRGLYFDEASWDGSDIFMPADDSAWIFVTELARRVFEANAKNIRFEALTDIEQIPAS